MCFITYTLVNSLKRKILLVLLLKATQRLYFFSYIIFREIYFSLVSVSHESREFTAQN